MSVTLTGHSGGGSFFWGFIDGQDALPDWLERIAFLDANYSFEPRHGDKIAAWLRRNERNTLVVLAYDDRNIMLDGKRVITDSTGGTWRASQRMMDYFRPSFALTAGYARRLCSVSRNADRLSSASQSGEPHPAHRDDRRDERIHARDAGAAARLRGRRERASAGTRLPAVDRTLIVRRRRHGRSGGTSSVGLREKNDVGTRRKPPRCAGMYGQSSGRGMCVMPSVYHSTTSVLASDRFARVHVGQSVVHRGRGSGTRRRHRARPANTA